jgi:RNA polymerase sigma factor (sigma-70 family)
LENKTDEALMVLYHNGDEKAFQILYARHAGKIYRFLKKRIQGDEKVQDVFQEVFSKIHRSKHLYNHTLPALPWIFTVTRTTLIDSLRREKNWKNEVEFDFDSIPAPASEMAASSAQQMIPEMAGLSAAQKSAIELRYLEEKTFEEIAKELKTSEMNVRQMISRGIKRIKDLVGEKP